MTYPTMPRPTDNTGDDHRAAIATLEEALKRNANYADEATEVRERAAKTVDQQDARLADLKREAISLQRGINALKAADQ